MSSTFKQKSHGVLLIFLFSLAALYISKVPVVQHLSLSPLVIGILLGMVYANSLRNEIPDTWVPGILFSSKTLLRAAIIFYGFRLTIQSVISVGIAAIVVDVIIVLSVLIIGYFLGKLLNLDSEITILTSAGSAICGAAAVLGTESVLRSQPYKTAVAVSTVVLFGTLSMFLYPTIYRLGIVRFDDVTMGLYTGSTLHEVAHVVGAGNAMNNSVIAANAIVVKMMRVILLAPVLLVLSILISRKKQNGEGGKLRKSKITIPWFAFGFLGVIILNSLLPHTSSVDKGIEVINSIDNFALTMAMTALGAETNFSKFKQAGTKPFILALFLYFWLTIGGYFIAKYASIIF